MFSPPRAATPFSGSRNPSFPHLRGHSLNSESTDTSSGARQMDVDERASEPPIADTYAKFDEFEASFYAYLPPELQMLRNADFFDQEYNCKIDPETSHTLLVTPTTAYAWKHTTKSPTTAYIFPCPTHRSSSDSTWGCFVPCENREPGIVLVSASGHIRFWDSVLLGLSGSERSYALRITLGLNEVVTGIFRCSHFNYIITTTSSAPYRLRLFSSSGKWSLSLLPFQRPASMLTRVTSILSGGKTSHSTEGTVISIALSPTQGNVTNAWLLLDSGLQQWSISEEGWEKIMFDEPQIIELIANGLAFFVGVKFTEFPDLDIELMDIAILKSTEIVLLVSHGTQEEKDGVASRSYALVKVIYNGEKVSVTQVQQLFYRRTVDLGMTSPCKLLVLRDRFAIVHFGAALVMISLNGKYHAILPLKSPLDRFLAISKLSLQVDGAEQIITLTATGFIGVKIDINSIALGDTRLREASLIKNTMLQAVLYGPLSHNPLQFMLPSLVDSESLSTSAEELSEAILQCRSEIALASIPSGLDMRSHIKDRLDRMHFLIEFISLNGAIERLSPLSRMRMENDAAKLFAAAQLWEWFNRRTVNQRSRILVDAVTAYMDSIGKGHEDDILRSFFRLHLYNLHDLFPHVLQTVRRQYEHSDLDERSFALAEANDILIITIRGSSQHRQEYENLYKIGTLASAAQYPWTTDSKVINALSGLFNLTCDLLQERVRLLGVPTDSQEDLFSSTTIDQILITQLGDLARDIFSCNLQRSKCLIHTTNEEREGFQRSMEKQQTTILLSLLNHGSGEAAFDLAEDYGDFRNLTELCQKTNFGSKKRTRGYIERYGEGFTAELFRYYLEHQNAKSIFRQDDKHSYLVDQYFNENPNARLSWIQCIRNQQYDQASTSLLLESSSEKHSGIKHVMLSIGLLSQYAYMDKLEYENIAGSEVQPGTEAFDVALDYISVQEELQNEFEEVISQNTFIQNLGMETKVELILTACYSEMETRPALLNAVRKGLRQLLRGSSLKSEDLIDLICSRDRVQPGTDYSTALFLLQGSTDLPEYTRDLLVRMVWRKLLIHDDWEGLLQTAELSDDQINMNIRRTALYKTLRATAEPRFRSCRMKPSQATVLPLPQEFERRWPGISADEVKALINDCEWERNMLSNSNVQVVYDQVVKLEEADRKDV